MGAAPPFGNLFGIDTYVDRALVVSPRIGFSAGTHTDAIVMDFGDYCRLAKPRVVNVAVKPLVPWFHVAQL